MKLRIFSRNPRPFGAAEDAADPAEPTWTMPTTRTCRGVQLLHVGHVMTCTSDTCPDVEARHVVSFRCIVMANPCPTCGAQAWGR